MSSSGYFKILKESIGHFDIAGYDVPALFRRKIIIIKYGVNWTNTCAFNIESCKMHKRTAESMERRGKSWSIAFGVWFLKLDKIWKINFPISLCCSFHFMKDHEQAFYGDVNTKLMRITWKAWQAMIQQSLSHVISRTKTRYVYTFPKGIQKRRELLVHFHKTRLKCCPKLSRQKSCLPCFLWLWHDGHKLKKSDQIRIRLRCALDFKETDTINGLRCLYKHLYSLWSQQTDCNMATGFANSRGYTSLEHWRIEKSTFLFFRWIMILVENWRYFRDEINEQISWDFAESMVCFKAS